MPVSRKFFKISYCSLPIYQTGTPLTTSRGFEIYEVTQPNVVGQYALSEDYTPSHFTGHLANEALTRLVNQSDPWFFDGQFSQSSSSYGPRLEVFGILLEQS
jgi:hypothetical protein